MKTVTTEIPAKVTKSVYECDYCSFQAPVPAAVKHHEFEKHQIKARHVIEGIEFYWLEDQQDFENLVGFYDHRADGHFDDTGWYWIHNEDDYDNEDYHQHIIDIRPIDNFIRSLKYDIVWAENEIKEAQELISKGRNE